MHDAVGLDNAFFYEKVKVGESSIGYVTKLDSNKVIISLLYKNGNVSIGDPVYQTNEELTGDFSLESIGKVVDLFGNDKLINKKFTNTISIPVEHEIVPIMDRTSVNRPMETGIAGIDLIYPIGRGQRQLIIGDKKTGKTQIALDAIVNQAGKSMLCIYVAIGKTKKEVKEIYYELLKRKATDYTIIVTAFYDDVPPLLYLTPYFATSIADYYMKNGYDVLVVIDDLKRHADAYREISLLSGKSPGRDAYPADIFYAHSRMLESGCQYKNGASITILPIVETKAGVITDYVLYTSEDNTYDYSVGGKSIREYLDETTEVLSKIIMEPELNNGMILVSRNLPEIKNLFLEPEQSDQNITENYYNNRKDIVILKQYSYIIDKVKWRVQELIDPSYGESYYRYLKSSSLKENEEIVKNELMDYSLTSGYVSAWKSNFGGNTKAIPSTKRIIDRLNTIQQAYKERLEDYQNKFNSLEKSFRFKVAENRRTSGLSNKYLINTIQVGGKDSLVTVVSMVSDNNGLYRSYSITVPVITTDRDARHYCLDEVNNIYLYQTVDGSNNVFVLVNSKTSGLDGELSGGKIESIYYRNFYQNDNIII